MKKTFKLLLCTSLLFTVCACGKDGEDATIKLNGNPTTGYEWTCKAEDASIVKIEKEYEEVNKDPELVGAPGVYEFEIEGLKEGTTTLNCEYLRSFEENSVVETAKYEIKVDSKLNVTYKELSHEEIPFNDDDIYEDIEEDLE